MLHGVLRSCVVIHIYVGDLGYYSSRFVVQIGTRHGYSEAEKQQKRYGYYRDVEGNIFLFHSSIYPIPRIVFISAPESRIMRLAWVMCISSVRVSP